MAPVNELKYIIIFITKALTCKMSGKSVSIFTRDESYSMSIILRCFSCILSFKDFLLVLHSKLEAN